ncbi:Kelch domain-containing protein 8B [Liparis tanakae]|uniref:Kelch domain-containing protein 8B n=1 Tax=Liparis tanakae TaxID=230148 RepID=A0A4Z2E1J5_9TELE|nr:Kelch domain-containing protein 8B [Liparis tanakae]
MLTARCSSALLQAANMLFVIGGVAQGPSNAVEALCLPETPEDGEPDGGRDTPSTTRRPRHAVHDTPSTTRRPRHAVHDTPSTTRRPPAAGRRVSSRVPEHDGCLVELAARLSASTGAAAIDPIDRGASTAPPRSSTRRPAPAERRPSYSRPPLPDGELSGDPEV